MRLFIAIQLPNKIKEKLVEIQKFIAPLGKLKLVEKENLHLTLYFLGEVEKEKVNMLYCNLKNLSDISSFTLSLKGIGSFPSISYPRVIWVGVEEGKEEVYLLHSKINECLTSIGFKSEKSYHPHVTLARLKILREKKRWTEVVEKYASTHVGEFKVSEWVLMESKLTKKGPKYSVLHNFKLS